VGGKGGKVGPGAKKNDENRSIKDEGLGELIVDLSANRIGSVVDTGV